MAKKHQTIPLKFKNVKLAKIKCNINIIVYIITTYVTLIPTNRYHF
jgi:hypothetical protein